MSLWGYPMIMCMPSIRRYTPSQSVVVRGSQRTSDSKIVLSRFTSSVITILLQPYNHSGEILRWHSILSINPERSSPMQTEETEYTRRCGRASGGTQCRCVLCYISDAVCLTGVESSSLGGNPSTTHPRHRQNTTHPVQWGCICLSRVSHAREHTSRGPSQTQHACLRAVGLPFRGQDQQSGPHTTGTTCAQSTYLP